MAECCCEVATRVRPLLFIVRGTQSYSLLSLCAYCTDFCRLFIISWLYLWLAVSEWQSYVFIVLGLRTVSCVFFWPSCITACKEKNFYNMFYNMKCVTCVFFFCQVCGRWHDKGLCWTILGLHMIYDLYIMIYFTSWLHFFSTQLFWETLKQPSFAL